MERSKNRLVALCALCDTACSTRERAECVRRLPGGGCGCISPDSASAASSRLLWDVGGCSGKARPAMDSLLVTL